MQYVEMLRARRVLTWYCGILLAVFVIVALSFYSGHSHISGRRRARSAAERHPADLCLRRDDRGDVHGTGAQCGVEHLGDHLDEAGAARRDRLALHCRRRRDDRHRVRLHRGRRPRVPGNVRRGRARHVRRSDTKRAAQRLRRYADVVRPRHLCDGAHGRPRRPRLRAELGGVLDRRRFVGGPVSAAAARADHVPRLLQPADLLPQRHEQSPCRERRPQPRPQPAHADRLVLRRGDARGAKGAT
jgi:hypothetical protein